MKKYLLSVSILLSILTLVACSQQDVIQSSSAVSSKVLKSNDYLNKGIISLGDIEKLLKDENISLVNISQPSYHLYTVGYHLNSVMIPPRFIN